VIESFFLRIYQYFIVDTHLRRKSSGLKIDFPLFREADFNSVNDDLTAFA
jgi:hypothetical protein